MTNSEVSSSYVIDDTPNELVRLDRQADMFNVYEGGILPEVECLDGINTVLDVASGPGTWAIGVAQKAPHILVTGIELIPRMLMFSQRRANGLGLKNVRFCEGDITKEFDIDDNSYDIANARLVQGVLNTSVWPRFIAEMVRVTRPGGTIRLTEVFGLETSSGNVNQLWHLLTKAFIQMHRSFLPLETSSGVSNLGIVFMLEAMLKNAGCIETRDYPHILDFSINDSNHELMLEHWRQTYDPFTVGKFMTQTGVVEEEEYQKLYRASMQDLSKDSFTGKAVFVTTTGKKKAL